jgi:hypothetical protein
MSTRPAHLAECWIELEQGTWRQARYDARTMAFVLGNALQVSARKVTNWVPADLLAQRVPELRVQ